MFAKLSNLLHSLTSHDADVEAELDRLREVSLEEKPYPPASPDIILCVDVHENQTALKKAIEYAREVYRPHPGSQIKFIPRLFALINFRALSPDQLWLVNTELIPSGASIFPYPTDCHSFTEAKRALEEQLRVARKDYVASRKNLKPRSQAPTQPNVIAATASSVRAMSVRDSGKLVTTANE